MMKQLQTNPPAKILVLPSWYPSQVDAYAGDFIKRHVQAIALLKSQYVIYVVKDEEGKITLNEKSTVNEYHGYTEKIIYYHVKTTGIPIVDRFLSFKKYNQIYKKAIRQYIAEKGKPNLIHVHVALKAGILALWAKNKWNIPFILTEHWTVYLPEANLRVEHLPLFFRHMLQKILKQTAAFTVVSNWLGKAVQKKFFFVKYTVIPNVVDHSIFFPLPNQHSQKVKFIHASTMNYQKNTEDIIRAFQILKINDCNAELNLFGPVQPVIQNLINELQLDKHVFLKGEVSQQILATEMQQSDALVLYSRFETFGCVIIEALATGIPVIVSDIPVFSELVTENENGLFVKGNDSKALAKKLMEFIINKKIYDTQLIQKSTEKYSYAAVGKQFALLYNQICNSTTYR